MARRSWRGICALFLAGSLAGCAGSADQSAGSSPTPDASRATTPSVYSRLTLNVQAVPFALTADAGWRCGATPVPERVRGLAGFRTVQSPSGARFDLGE